MRSDTPGPKYLFIFMQFLLGGGGRLDKIIGSSATTFTVNASANGPNR